MGCVGSEQRQAFTFGDLAATGHVNSFPQVWWSGGAPYLPQTSTRGSQRNVTAECPQRIRRGWNASRHASPPAPTALPELGGESELLKSAKVAAERTPTRGIPNICGLAGEVS